MATSPVAVLRAVLHRVVLPVYRRVRPFLHQTEGPEDPLLHQVLGVVAGVVGFLVLVAVSALGLLASAGYAAVYPIVRAGEEGIRKGRGVVGRLRR